MRPRLVVPLVAGLAALLLAGCQFLPPSRSSAVEPEGTEVPFETIALDEWGVNDEMGTEPQLILITSEDDLTSVQDFVREEDFAKLQQIDFSTYGVIALFRGVKETSNFKTVIERITQRNSTLLVDARFWVPQSGAAQLTSPYHLVKISRDYISAQTQLELRVSTVQP